MNEPIVRYGCFVIIFQLGVRLDDLLELVCTDIQADTIEEAETALRILQEKVDTIGKFYRNI